MGDAPHSSSSSSSSSAPESSPSVSKATEPKSPCLADDKRRHERLLVVYQPLVGKRVTAFLSDGAVFEGLLDSFVTAEEFALILRMATMLRAGHEVVDTSIKVGVTFELMNIRFDDLSELKSRNGGSESGGIGTDSGISAKKGSFGKERELHRWVAPEDSEGSKADPLTLAKGSGGASWDQFATNEKLFGLKTDFNEEIYTTRLDRSAEHVKAKEVEAERLAREIMSSPASNVHLAQERGKALQAEADEEALYGAVLRSEKEALAVAQPPGFSSKPDAATVSETAASPSIASSKLNPNAGEFKLNVAANEFVPSVAPAAANVYYYNRSQSRNIGYHQPLYPAYVPQQYYPCPAVPAAPVEQTASEPVKSEAKSEAKAEVKPESASSSAAKPAGLGMNPNATAFYMPPPVVPMVSAYSPYAVPYPSDGYYGNPYAAAPQAAYIYPNQQQSYYGANYSTPKAPRDGNPTHSPQQS